MSSFRSETKELNEATRREAGGSFIMLTDGVTHYELSNSTQDETVVLVHGFSVPYFIYDPTFRFLTEQGFRVLRYDLFGRGFSDRPDTDYNLDLFVRQLSDLLNALGLMRPVSLVGLSMGGPITATFTARNPQRVHKLVWIDPAGARALPYAGLLRIITKPSLARAILNLAGDGGSIRRLAARFLDQHLDSGFQEQYLRHIQFKGTRNAILSTLRNGVVDSCIDTYRQVRTLQKPVLLFWGRHDTTVPLRHSDDLRAAIPHLEFHLIENATHIPHYEQPAETNPILLEFLRRPG